MIYLTGATNLHHEPHLAAAGVGLINQPRSYAAARLSAYPFWAADNGCFWPATYVGDDRWLDWLDRMPRDRCLFAVVPDVARRPDGTLGGDPVATWRQFQELSPIVRAMGFPAALAAQDGMQDLADVADQIDACDCLFIAGSDEWKTGAAARSLVRRARDAGKWVHLGRCNSFERIELARFMGCLSTDGTFFKYAPDRHAPEIMGWLASLRAQPMLPLFDAFEAPDHPTHRAAHLAQ